MQQLPCANTRKCQSTPPFAVQAAMPPASRAAAVTARMIPGTLSSCIQRFPASHSSCSPCFACVVYTPSTPSTLTLHIQCASIIERPVVCFVPTGRGRWACSKQAPACCSPGEAFAAAPAHTIWCTLCHSQIKIHPATGSQGMAAYVIRPISCAMSTLMIQSRGKPSCCMHIARALSQP